MIRRREGRDERDAGSLRRRIALSTAALGALVSLALIGLVQVVLAHVSTDAVDRVLTDRADAVVASTTGAPTGSELAVPDAELGPGVAVYDRTGRLVAGSVPPSLSAAFGRLTDTSTSATLSVNDEFRLLGRHFTTADGTDGVVVVAEPLQPYENDERTALLISIAAGGVIVAAATLLASWASRRALAPVAAMAAAAEDWSEHDLERRFDLGPPTNEIRALGHTLDQLLGRVAGAITAEQRLTSELAHELRTPLTSIKATADLLALRPDLDTELREDVAEIQQSCRVMAATITGLLELARSQAVRDDAPTGCTLLEVLEDVRRTLPEADRLSVERTPGPLLTLSLAVPRELAARALSPVIVNALQHADHVHVSMRVTAGRAHVLVADDGPGVAPADVERIFEPGTTSSGGSGLGLALARRVARSVGGDVAVDDGLAPGSGARFVVTFPITAGVRH